ncbi:MAG: hypothetical protein OEU09_13830 [Rhodospirillales bacterium]|nr:hypothetical protein [Rhodospirillales bacterium]MDH3790938.1 hypothetical protein [Rhodospirillales bacterium]MDH3912368.1 hypothetical protein [Rhodospirillales bacterium]
MVAPSKSFTPILDTQIDANSPINVTLMTSIRDSLVHLEEWLGDAYTAAKDHNHDGVNSAFAGGLQLIDTAVASASATLEVTGMSSSFDLYLCTLIGFQPATDNQDLWLRTGLTGTYAAGAADYEWGLQQGTLGALSPFSDASDTEINLHDPAVGMGNAADEFGDWRIWIYNPAATVQDKRIEFTGHYLNAAGGRVSIPIGVATRLSTGAIDGLRFLYDVGNIAAGTARLYGVQNA